MLKSGLPLSVDGLGLPPCPGNELSFLKPSSPQHAEPTIGWAVAGTVGKATAGVTLCVCHEVELLEKDSATKAIVSLVVVTNSEHVAAIPELVIDGPFGDV